MKEKNTDWKHTKYEEMWGHKFLFSFIPFLFSLAKQYFLKLFYSEYNFLF